MRFARTNRGVQLAAAIFVAGAALALAGCAQSMSEFAQAAVPGAPQSGQVMLEPTSTGPTIGNGVVRPAVLVEETTVPAPKKTPAYTAAPPLPSPEQTATAYSPGGNYPNMNLVPEQPKTKLLSPEEKDKVVAELERLAKAQNAATEKAKKATRCASENVKPADRLKGETAGAEC